ncbi:MAG: peptide chain release factor N(5)-glutamine methyltransferase [Pricia sp.]
MLLKEIKNIFHKELEDLYPKEEIDSFFHLLIEHYLGLERFVLALQPHLTVTKQEEQPLFEALSALRSERPIQHIIGKAHFMEMDFKVSENVLIPRPETEELVRWILDGQNQKGKSKKQDKALRILDIGTGSGCIAISLAQKLPDAELFALDVSSEALKVARENASLHEVDVQFIEADILEWDGNSGYGEGILFDIIVSNPPYVRNSEKKEMRKNVLDNEPELSLFVTDEHPLKYYEAIARFAQENLMENGALYLEINQYLSEETEKLLRIHSFSQIELRRDLFGNFRMIKCCKGAFNE